MGYGIAVVVGALIAVFVEVHAHPERSPIIDPSQARALFKRVAEGSNNTEDGHITHVEVADIFSVFDADGDGEVTGAEFKDVWQTRQLGDAKAASYLFSRADTNHDGSITKFPDMERVFHYFDLNADGDVNEVEFIIIWNSMSS